MRFTSDFWIKNQDASDILTRTLDGIATDDFTYIAIGRTKFWKDLELHSSDKADAEFDQIFSVVITNQVLRSHR